MHIVNHLKCGCRTLYTLYLIRDIRVYNQAHGLIDYFDQKIGLYTMLSSDKDSMEPASRNVSIFDI